MVIEQVKATRSFHTTRHGPGTKTVSDGLFCKRRHRRNRLTGSLFRNPLLPYPDDTGFVPDPVRQSSILPAALFRLHLAMTPLVVRLMVPAAGPIENLHPQAGVPCRAHTKKRQASPARLFFLCKSHAPRISLILFLRAGGLRFSIDL